MKTKKNDKLEALKNNMDLPPLEEVNLDENIGFSVEIPLQMLFDQFKIFVKKKDFKKKEQ